MFVGSMLMHLRCAAMQLIRRESISPFWQAGLIEQDVQ
jgi:hypothetical protein